MTDKELFEETIWKDAYTELQTKIVFPLPTFWEKVLYRIKWLLGIHLYKHYRNKRLLKCMKYEVAKHLCWEYNDEENLL